MNKLLFLILFINLNLLGQNLDSLGIDSTAYLNKPESDYLNKIFKEKKSKFDFINTKIGFFIGSSNHRVWSKIKYFENVKECIKNSTKMQDQLLILDENEKLKSAGYDAFIVSWSKIFVYDKDNLINKLNNKSKKVE